MESRIDALRLQVGDQREKTAAIEGVIAALINKIDAYQQEDRARFAALDASITTLQGQVMTMAAEVSSQGKKLDRILALLEGR